MGELPLRGPAARRTVEGAHSAAHGYVLYGSRSWRNPRRALLVVSGVVAALTVSAVAVWAVTFRSFDGSESLWYPLLALCAVVVVVMLARGLRRPELLRIDGKGVAYNEVMVPWRSVYQLIVFRREARGADASPQVGIRLNPGAPLPTGIASLVTLPSDSFGIPDTLKTHITSARIDIASVFDAAQRFAPSDVALVEHVGGEERVLRR